MSNFFKRRTIIIAAIILISFLIGIWIIPVSLPLIIAFITALFLEPAIKLFHRQFKFKRNLSVLFVFILFLMFIGASGYFLTTKVITEAIKIGENAPQYINEINEVWKETEKNMSAASQDLPIEFVTEVSQSVQDFLENMKNELKDKINFKNITNILTNIPSYLVSFLVYLIALFMFMVELPNIKKRFYSHLTTKTADKVTFMTSRLSYVVFGFFKAQFLVSIIIFIVSLIGLLYIAPEVALVMSFIIWIIDFIPLIGSIAVLGPWALFHFITGDLVLGTELAVLATILLIIRRTIEPKVMGQHIGLSPLSTLIAMFLGLQLFGILGFIIGPLLVIAFNSAREAGIIKLNFKI